MTSRNVGWHAGHNVQSNIERNAQGGCHLAPHARLGRCFPEAFSLRYSLSRRSRSFCYFLLGVPNWALMNFLLMRANPAYIAVFH